MGQLVEKRFRTTEESLEELFTVRHHSEIRAGETLDSDTNKPALIRTFITALIVKGSCTFQTFIQMIDNFLPKQVNRISKAINGIDRKFEQ